MTAPHSSTDPRRVLGCAFAAADLMFELDADQRVSFALGAAKQLIGGDAHELAGQDWRAWVAPDDRAMAAAFIEGMQAGERRGPVTLRLAGAEGRSARLTAVSLPELWPGRSCALSLVGAGEELATPVGRFGLQDQGAFRVMAERMVQNTSAGAPKVDLTLVELRPPADRQLTPELVAGVAAILRAESLGGVAATQLADDRFALLRQGGRALERLTERVTEVSGAPPEVVTTALDRSASPGVSVRALRLALERFSGASEAGGAQAIALSFEQQVGDVQSQAARLSAIIAERSFELAFQPIVTLASGAVHHYEVLVRLPGEDSPFELIKVAEALDMIQPLDLTIVEAALARLQSPEARSARVAVNLSARSLLDGEFMNALLQRLRADLVMATPQRLQFEITESAEIPDLDRANRHIQRLRKLGFRVALDDFGAGAASLEYLRRLSVDAVKIDGRYVQTLLDDPRNEAVLRHMVQLCRELELSTIAEMVETSAVDTKLRTLGVTHGQGWLYGRPQPALGRGSARSPGVVRGPAVAIAR